MTNIDTPISDSLTYHVGDNPIPVVEAGLAKFLEQELIKARGQIADLERDLATARDKISELEYVLRRVLDDRPCS